MRQWIKVLFLFPVMMAVTGCSAVRESAGAGSVSISPPRTMMITSLYQSNDCQSISRGGFMLLQDPVVLEDLLTPLGQSTAQSLVGEVNFQTEDVLVVDFGAQPTKAVSMGLASNRLALEGSTAVVQLNLPQRVSGKKQAQVLSHPCEYYLLPKTGHQSVEIRSQHNDVLTQFDNL